LALPEVTASVNALSRPGRKSHDSYADPDSYADIVRAHGLPVELRGRWATVGQSQRKQGWKLHVSSVPSQAERLLSIILPILSVWQTPFKVARSEEILALLNEGSLSPTQIGKFVTIYPPSDAQSRSAADELIAVTQDFDGPEVTTDLRLGRVVYARYGGFDPEMERDRLGHVFSVLHDEKGAKRPDDRVVPFFPPPGIHNPFAQLAVKDRVAPIQPGRSKLFGPGYLLLDVIKAHPTGSVFLALDMRDPANVATRVLKEGRAHCLSDRFGRDTRTRLRHQLAVHRALVGRVCIPTADEYFEVGDNGYLALEYVDGTDIGATQPRPFGTLAQAEQQLLLLRLSRLTEAIDALHSAGYVHRDLTPTNIRVRVDGSIALLDLELAHSVRNEAPPFAQGTAGFMSPEQKAGMLPDYAQDIYGLGALMAWLFTGIDPRRLLYAGERGRMRQLCVLGGLPDALAQLVSQCLATDPLRRPSICEVGEILQVERARAATSVTRPVRAGLVSQSRDDSALGQIDRCLPKITHGLLHNVLLDSQTGLWLSPRGGVHERTEITSNYALHRSANRGVAGVVYALARLARFGVGGRDVHDRVRQAVDWLLTHAATPDDQLPGLHSGEGGVALAIVEAVQSGLIEKDGWLDEYLAEALNGPLDWPDLTHGAAGQGIAAIACGDLMQDGGLADLSRRCAHYLLDTQDADGGWTLPEGVATMTGSRYLGFAHGVAGEVYFLAEWASRFDDADGALAARRGADWLMRHAEATDWPKGALAWPAKLGEHEIWRWWCHGAPGIALTFLKMFETTGIARYADIAAAALQAHPTDIRYSNLSQCHGLSGLGEIYLEAACVLGEEIWLDRAMRIAEVLLDLAREDGNSIGWLVEDPFRATADLMIGCAGVGHFLLRLRHDELSAPLLPKSRRFEPDVGTPSGVT
jgi:tRNA A-37 threonylcarbamoyl transferase component Bud32